MGQAVMDTPDRPIAERRAFERLVEEYADRVYNVALRITGSPSEAEDAMQEAFESAFRAWPRFRGESSPATWLYRIAVNASLMRLRARRPVEYLTELSASLEVQDWSDTMAEHTQSAELRERLLTGLTLLGPEQRAALVLRDIDGLSTAEAAAALEITEEALKSRLHRARALLRSYLADYFGDR
jgi:RNA polymerase sigma-70 factor, ECF subfamily